jgi:hypothetical protein
MKFKENKNLSITVNFDKTERAIFSEIVAIALDNKLAQDVIFNLDTNAFNEKQITEYYEKFLYALRHRANSHSTFKRLKKLKEIETLYIKLIEK